MKSFFKRCRYGVSIIEPAKNLKSQFSMPLNTADKTTNIQAPFSNSLTFNVKQIEAKEFDLVFNENGCKEDILYGKRK